MNELKNRGVSDLLIAVVDGLKGFPEAITAVFPQTIVQTCIIHLIRHSMDFASWKDRKVLAGGLKTIYRAKDADAARAALEAFDASQWGQKYPAIAQSWRRNWERVIPFFAFPEAVRRIIYTTNAIEALNAKLRRAVRTRGHFPTDDAATKLLFLVLRQAAGEWKMPPREWFEAKTQFAIMFDDRFVQAMAQPAPHTRFLTVPPLAAPGFGLVARFGVAAHDGLVRQSALGAHRIRRLVDFLRQRLRTGQPEDVIDGVGLAPFHRLGPGIVAVAPEGDARPGPALADMAHEPAQMGAHLDPRRGSCRTQHDRDGTRALGVVDMDRQKAALVVMGVEERELLMPVHDIAGVVDIEQVSSISRMTDAGSRS